MRRIAILECSFCVVFWFFPENGIIFAKRSVKISHVMAKKVIICEGDFRVFRTLGEVSEAFDVSPTSVSMALGDGRLVRGLRMRWADRVFLVRSGGRWRVCVLDSRDRLVELDGGGRVGKRGIDAVKDITAVFYYSKEIW